MKKSVQDTGIAFSAPETFSPSLSMRGQFLPGQGQSKWGPRPEGKGREGTVSVCVPVWRVRLKMCNYKYRFLLTDSRECPSDSTAIRRDMPSHGFFFPLCLIL